MPKERSIDQIVEELIRAEQSRGRLRRDARSVEAARETLKRQIEAEKAKRDAILEGKSSPTKETPKERPERESLLSRLIPKKSSSISYASGPKIESPTPETVLKEPDDEAKAEALKMLREVLEEEKEKKGREKQAPKQPVIHIHTDPVEVVVDYNGPEVPANAVYIQLDAEGYPIYPSMAEKFRKLNKIIATNRWRSFFLVEARNSYAINPGPGYELPASIIRAKNRPFIVDFGKTIGFEDPYGQLDWMIKKGQIYPASGVIIPRKVRLVADTMLGWKHNYVLLDNAEIPDNAFDDIKKANEEYWEPPYFD